jgi:hypothetical protein
VVDESSTVGRRGNDSVHGGGVEVLGVFAAGEELRTAACLLWLVLFLLADMQSAQQQRSTAVGDVQQGIKPFATFQTVKPNGEISLTQLMKS